MRGQISICYYVTVELAGEANEENVRKAIARAERQSLLYIGHKRPIVNAVIVKEPPAEIRD